MELHILHTIADLKAGKLKGLTQLKISENLTEFPIEILKLSDSLEVLDLNDNQLSNLPSDLSKLKKLRILFISNNHLEHIPTVLADCPALTMIGIKSNKVKTVAENSLPINIQWLILTGNQITKLPDSMGQLTKLQKLALAGNQLTELPASMKNCQALELIRLSANQLTALPDFLLKLPKLTWIAFAGNPFHQPFKQESDLPIVSFDDLESHEVLGQGASGVISRATWVDNQHELANSADSLASGSITSGSAANNSVAIKVYKGAVTSDGYANDELGACVTAGVHPNLVGVIAKVEKETQLNSETQLGLIMSLIKPEFKNLGEPPTLQSCTRDHFKDDFTLSLTSLLKIIKNIADVMQHLRKKGISHGDLYAHNILVTNNADTLLTDFGAASNYTSLDDSQTSKLEKIEVRAFGCLVDDLLACCHNIDLEAEAKDETHIKIFQSLIMLKNNCMTHNVTKRPSFSQININLESNFNIT